MLTQFPDGLVAVVSDSYDVWNACENVWGDQLKGLVEERGEREGRLVVRPDSGDPPEIVVKVCIATKTGVLIYSKDSSSLRSF